MNIIKENFGVRGAAMRNFEAKCMMLSLFFFMAALLPWPAQAGTSGKVYNLSLDIGTLDNRPLYSITSFPTTFKVRAKVMDQLGAPITGLTSTQLVIQSGRNVATGVVWTKGTEFSVGTFTELGNGLYDWTATLNPGALAANNIGQLEVRVTGTPATDNQWLANTIFVKNGPSSYNDVKYVEVQPLMGNSGYQKGDYGVLIMGSPDFPFQIQFYGPDGPSYIGEVKNSYTPTGDLVLGLGNWTQSAGSIPADYSVTGYHDYSGGYVYHLFLKGNSSYFYHLTDGQREYITVSVKKGNYEFLVPMGLTAVVNTGTNPAALPVPTYNNPYLFPATQIQNWHDSWGPVTISPGGAATTANMFIVNTNTGTDTIQDVSIDLSTGAAATISRIDITDDVGTTVYGSLTDPTTDNPVVHLTSPLNVSTNTAFYLVRITPKSQADMPSIPGSSHVISGNVTSISHTAPNPVIFFPLSGTPFLTIDNLSPANPTWNLITPGNGQVKLFWTNPLDADFNQSVILRNTVQSVDTPAEGATYVAGSVIGTSTVACVTITPGTNCTDSGLTNGNGYYYRIFAKDARGNYSAGGTASGPHILGQQTTPGTCTADAAGPTALTVTMPYSNDTNSNNRYSVDYKLSSSGSWINWANAAAHTGSPYITTITGLSQSNSYDVRCTFLDDNAVDGISPQLMAGVVLPDYRTTAGNASAGALNANSIHVEMPYSDDQNDSNRYTVEYRMSTDLNWTSWVTEAPHTASPYSTTITGLTQAESYDIRVTYLDSDGVTGVNPKLISGIIQPDNRTLAGTVIASATGVTAIEVNVPFDNDANGNGTLTVEYMKPGAFSWTTLVSGNQHPTNPYVTTIKGLVPGTAYDIKVTYQDPDGVTGIEEQTIFNVKTPESKLLHNSKTTNTKGYWAEYGGWGIPNGQYGEFTCLTCHTKRTQNASRIKNFIKLNPLPGSDNFGGPVRFDGTSGIYSFGDDSIARTSSEPANRICEVCHTQTADFDMYFDGSKWVRVFGPTHRKTLTTPGNHAGSNNNDCTRCHKHDNGFAGKPPWW